MMLKNIMAENDLDLKFLVIGDSGVGKVRQNRRERNIGKKTKPRFVDMFIASIR